MLAGFLALIVAYSIAVALIYPNLIESVFRYIGGVL
jgi:hypothetical protein